MNLASILILALVLLAAVLALRAMRRGRKSGSYSCGCEGCSCRDLCDRR